MASSTKPPSANLSELLGAAVSSMQETPLHAEAVDEWELRYFRSSNSRGGYLMHAVQMVLAGTVRARMTTVRPGQDDDAVVDHLRHKALAWIDDYGKRDHSGTTDFGPL
ncbi:MAG: hypothetical protein J0H69_09495 [Burkholderiales bacterium]|nr:hypothetical protein [Burkholderiales bacterium]